MNNQLRKKTVALVALLCCIVIGACCGGCVSLHPVVSSHVTPAPTPTPTPEPLRQSLPLPAPALDAAGNAIEGEEHYNRYISFTDLRVYEYGMGTLMDGKCFNQYPAMLTGEATISFFDQQGDCVAKAVLHTAETKEMLLLPPGETRIYAEIDTDMDVQMMDFSLEVEKNFVPDVEE